MNVRSNIDHFLGISITEISLLCFILPGKSIYGQYNMLYYSVSVNNMLIEFRFVNNIFSTLVLGIS